MKSVFYALFQKNYPYLVASQAIFKVIKAISIISFFPRKPLTAFFIAFILLTSCGKMIHNMHKRESNRRFLKLEQRNFVKEKSPTQWWYYDFFFEDGSVMVMLFTPHHWWMDKDPQSLFYVSYQKANGEVVRDHHIFSPDSVKYSQDSIKSKWLTIVKNHTKKTRE